MYLWTTQQLRDAIERCEKECQEMVERHDRPEKIECARRGIENLRRWLKEAETLRGD